MLGREINDAKKLLKEHESWCDFIDNHTFINCKLEGKANNKYTTFGNIACASVSSDPTSKNPNMCRSTIFIIWIYYPNDETIEKSLEEQIKNINWDEIGYDWDY